MPRGKRAVGFGAGTVIAVSMLLSGCASTTTTRPTDTPVATPTPAFTSDADATAAAIAFYKRYLKVATAASRDPKGGAQTLRPYLGDAQYKSEESDLENLAEAGEHFEGAAALSGSKVQKIDRLTGTISMYLCLDVSRLKVVDEGGKDRTPEQRGDQQNIVVDIRGLNGTPLIDSSERWSGASVCS